MATFVKVSLPQIQQELFNDAFSIVKEMDMTFSTYKPQALAFKLNKEKYLEDTPDSFLELLSICKELYKITQGYFSIAVGSLTKRVYRFGQKDAQIPTSSQLKSAKSDLLGFSVKGKRVILEPEVSIDFGGIAKGFTVDKLKSFLQKKGVKEFRIGLSGDIYCQGSCSVAIQSPFEAKGLVTVLHLKDTAISTSGNYERYISSKKYNHLLNPKHKKPQQEIASMTLYSQVYSNTLLDALATALSVMPMEIRLYVLSQYPAINYIFIKNNKELYHNIKKLHLDKKFRYMKRVNR